MYSGQGSQYYQMGKALFDENHIFKTWMLKGDGICKDHLGISVLEVLYNEKNPISQPFSKTLLTHPAIFILEYALTQVLLEQNIRPDFVLGTSMGEFAAAAVSGALGFETTLKIVIKQAEILEQSPEGSMLAVLADPNFYQTQSYLNQNSELAAINFSSHFVVSGGTENVKIIIERLNESNILSQLLPVSKAFHSYYIDNDKPIFLQAIEQLEIQNPSIPIISCVTETKLNSLTEKHFWDIIRSPILFQSTIQHLEHEGPMLYIDIGPSGTLSTFVKYNLSKSSKSKFFSILTLFGHDSENFENVKNFFINLK